MAATRRSDIACARINVDLLNADSCLGKDGYDPCEVEIPLQYREFAYYIVGQGAHLFSDNGELRGILIEAANLLYCNEKHREQCNELVKKWLVNWKNAEKINLMIRNLVHKRARERGPLNEKWQAAFENVIGQIVRSDIPDCEKLESVKKAIHNDENDHVSAVHRQWSVVNKLNLKIRVPEPQEYQKPNTLPTVAEHAGARVLPSVSAEQPLGTEGSATEEPRTDMVRINRSRSASTTSTVLRAITKQFHRFTGSTESIAAPPPPPRLETAGPANGQSSITHYGMPGNTRAMADDDDTLEAVLAEQAQAPADVCNICMHTLDRNNLRDFWLCQMCKGEAHMTCFQQWKITNMDVGKRTPCPFCRVVIRREIEYS